MIERIHTSPRSDRWWRGAPRFLTRLCTDADGALFVEYISLVVLVTLIAALSVAALGIPLIRQYELTKLLLTAPIP
ncbi:MAG: hypothetical protein H6715_00220 [Myxococcales bacterium]|nr:hypothetical protein [Myxococcales bacterium]MCB9707389.1 hypothetical protein [Myxococcales bacterium]